MTLRKFKIRDLWLHGKILGSSELLNVGLLNVKAMRGDEGWQSCRGWVVLINAIITIYDLAGKSLDVPSS